MSYKRLNEPKLLSWAVDFMVSGEFFYVSMRANVPPPPGVVEANLGPMGMVGRIYIVNPLCMATY